MSQLRGQLVGYVHSHEGRQADVLLREPNGEEHLVRCLVKNSSIEIGGDGECIAYLNHRYGPQAVSITARNITLGVTDELG